MTALKQWYALHCKPGCEFRVGDALREKGHAYVIPYVKRRMRGAKRHERRVPIFSRYVFFAFAADARWDDVKAIEPKPVKPLSFDGSPATITQAEIAYIANLRELPKPADMGKIVAGVLAKIIAGPFSTINGAHKVETVEDGLAGLDIAMLGAKRRVRMPVKHLAAA